jgi:phosphatidate cytidylyltransferase
MGLQLVPVDVKDSGKIMPGHGGLLDRFDAFLFILPVLALLQLVFG